MFSNSIFLLQEVNPYTFFAQILNVDFAHTIFLIPWL